MTCQTPDTELWIGRPEPKDAPRMRLICLPYAGGNTATYRPWAALLPDDIELCLAQLPGREKRIRETPRTNLEELVTELAEALPPLLERPYALFGHSMGALTAFALASRLRNAGQPAPAHLFVSGRRAPQIPEVDSPIHQLPDAAFVVAMIRRYNGIPQIFLQNIDMLRLFLPTLRGDLTMLETYRYSDTAPFDFPITVFGGWEDARTTQVDLAGWRDLSTGDFALHMFPGGHFFIQTAMEPVVRRITATLARPLVADRSTGILSSAAV